MTVPVLEPWPIEYSQKVSKIHDHAVPDSNGLGITYSIKRMSQEAGHNPRGSGPEYIVEHEIVHADCFVRVPVDTERRTD